MNKDELEFTIVGRVRWACYWALWAVKDYLGCTDFEIQTCPLTIKVTRLRTSEVIGNGGWDLELRGQCRGTSFVAQCLVWNDGTKSSLRNLYVGGRRDMVTRYWPESIPGYQEFESAPSGQ